MINSVFDSNLDDFFYGDTCTTESPVPLQDQKRSIANINRRKETKISLKAMVVAGFIGVTVALGVGGIAATKVSRIKGITAFSSGKTHLLDDRSKEELINVFVTFREDYRFTQDEVADLLGLSKSTISKFERGEHFPDARALKKYSDFISLLSYLKDKTSDRKFAIRQIFHLESKVFGGLNSFAFAKQVGENGLREVSSIIRRIYG
jgi:transcriptional regulator with XRE-family HTH domain